MKITGKALTLTSLAAIMISNPAIAKPTYLACTLMIDGQPEHINFTTDEQAGTVSILIVSSGSSRTVRGAFTPDKVIIDERSVRWEIDRTDLGFSRTITMINSTTNGQCKIQTVPKRAF